ncbi:PWWP domain-containing protein 4-like [Actinidia eriantha]|uniref:PWWP domain-containing protein 4-like n=1 Tax=Actinidia eriantha TaxID=165200 RepID=UPI0025875A09|nr:PWWP domain-containing protein 4-like [Actinidia eriantha]XP_057476021.1 PWWP domain-containing protein 4-like [Actinidia eriantha]
MGSEQTRNSSGHKLMDMYSRIKLRASDDRVSAGSHGNSSVKNVKSMNDQSEKVRVYDDINFRRIGKKKEGIDFTVKPKELAIGGNNTIASRSTKMVHLMALAEQEAVISSKEIKGNRQTREKQAIIDFDYSDSTVDERTTLEMLDALKEQRLKNVGYEYEVGDMVWGKVESYPWWPGQIYNEVYSLPSVRNTKKEGHVLVAFYGDNTYGWLEPGGLIPFDPHYTEKSKQTNTEAFLNAVGEAKDEVNRRAALGLTCYCRAPNNFRPSIVQGSIVQGFFDMDLAGFGYGNAYSLKQIERARDAFQPLKTLSFVRKLALMPQSDMQRNVEWTKNVAHLLAYRRAVFEKHDETYAQAFGVQSSHPGCSSVPEEAPLQAPSSGQPVIAKTLGESKGLADRIKVKDQKKGKIDLARQSDNVNVSRVQKLSKAGKFGSQKRAPPTTMKPIFLENQDADGIVGRDFVASSLGIAGKEATTAGFHGINLAAKQESHGLSIQQKSGSPALKPLKILLRPDDATKSSNKCQASRILEKSMKRPNELKEVKSLATRKKAGIQKPSKVQVDKKMSALSVSTKPTKVTPKALEGNAEPKMLVTPESLGLSIQHKSDHPSALKQSKKRPRLDDPTKTSNKCEATCPLEKFMKRPETLEIKSLGTKTKEGGQKPPKVKGDDKIASPSVSAKPTKVTPEKLKGKAGPAMLVTPKNLGLGIQPKSDHPSALKPLKKRPRPDDPTMASNKSQASCFVEKSMMKANELRQMKSSVAEKKASNQKHPKVQADEKMAATSVSTMPVKVTPETLEGDAYPTMLVMKFPPQSALPSVSELKARFVRYGKLDESATRVFWKSSICQVVFRNISNAQAAYKHAVQNRTLFGNMEVDYCLRPTKVSVPELPESMLGGNASSREAQLLPSTNKSSVARIVHAINMKYCEEARNKESCKNTSAITHSIDISEKMLTLMKKCRDIVANIQS